MGRTTTEYNRRYYAEHREQERERNRRYRAAHPDKNRQTLARVRDEIHSLLGGRCLVCGARESLEIDHALGNGTAARQELGPMMERLRIRDALRADPFDGRFILLCHEHHVAKTKEAKAHV